MHDTESDGQHTNHHCQHGELPHPAPPQSVEFEAGLHGPLGLSLGRPACLAPQRTRRVGSSTSFCSNVSRMVGLGAIVVATVGTLRITDLCAGHQPCHLTLNSSGSKLVCSIVSPGWQAFRWSNRIQEIEQPLEQRLIAAVDLLESPALAFR